jgi:DNA-binding NarL/FixJ family response regulator
LPASTGKTHSFQRGRGVLRPVCSQPETPVALGHGMSDKEIAEHLCIRHQTVRTHMVNLLGELGIESRL